MSEQFTDINDYVLDQIYGYQDANEFKNNTLRLRDAFDHEHVWSNTSDTNLGNHEASFCITAYIADLAVTNAKLANGVIGVSKLQKTSYDTTHGIYNTSSWNTYGPIGTATNYTGLLVNATLGYVVETTIRNQQVNPSLYCFFPGVVTSGTVVSLQVATRHYYLYGSPPYKLGNKSIKNTFIYMLRDKTTGEIKMSAVGEEPPWYTSIQKEIHHKDSPIHIHNIPHPFVEYAPFTNRKAEDEGLEIILVFDDSLDGDEIIKEKELSLQKHREIKDELVQKGVSLEALNEIEAKLINEVNSENKRYQKVFSSIETDKELRLKDLKNASKEEVEMAMREAEDNHRHLLNKFSKRIAHDRLNEQPLSVKLHSNQLKHISEATQEDNSFKVDVKNFTDHVKILKAGN